MAEYDIVIVGGGTAGLVTAAGSAGLGARAALIEADRLGGECLWTGCVPSKALIACARAADEARRASRFGVEQGEATIDFARAMSWVREAQRRIEPHDSPERFRSLGVDVIMGAARLLGPRSLSVDDRRITTRRIVLATGSKPAIPPLDGLSGVPFVTNESIFALSKLPQRLLVLGGGPVGLELAQAFARLGSRVTVIEASPHLLPTEDAELVELLAEALSADGVELRLGAQAVLVARNGDEVRLTMHAADDTTAVLTGDVLLVATGRTPNIEMLQLDRAGVDTSKRGIIVDRKMRTTCRGIWAAGDVTGGLRFTHVADYQARLVVRNAFFPFAARAAYTAVPWVIYTEPELAHVGLTEAEARARHGNPVRVWRRPFNDVDRAIADGAIAGMVKLVTTARGHVLGGHVIGRGAGNLIGEITLAMKYGLSATKLGNAIRPYPTYPEAIRQAADQYTRSRFTGVVRTMARWIVRH